MKETITPRVKALVEYVRILVDDGYVRASKSPQIFVDRVIACVREDLTTVSMVIGKAVVGSVIKNGSKSITRGLDILGMVADDFLEGIFGPPPK